MKKKKACLISKFIYQNDTRLQQQVAILIENNYKVDVLCYLDGEKSKTLKNGSRIYGVAEPGKKDTFGRYILNTIRFSIPAFFKLQFLNLKGKYDVIIVHTLPELLVFIPLFQKILGSKIILDIRDTSVELFASKWDNGNKKYLKNIITLLANLSCKFADKLIVASPGFREKLLERKIPEDKITLIFNSADTNIFKFDKDRTFKKITENLKIIYHGSIADRFGLDIAIKAIAKVKDKIPGTSFDVYGFYDDEYKNYLEQLIDELSVNNVVHLHGRLNLEMIYDKIKDADIGIVPYKDEFFMQLAFSTKLFEYVVSGIPVITSRLKPAEFVFDNDSIFFVQPNNSEQLAEKIIEICFNPEIRKTQVKKGFSNYQKISSQIMKERYLNIIENIK